MSLGNLQSLGHAEFHKERGQGCLTSKENEAQIVGGRIEASSHSFTNYFVRPLRSRTMLLTSEYVAHSTESYRD